MVKEPPPKLTFDEFIRQVDWRLKAVGHTRQSVWPYDYEAAFRKGLCVKHTVLFALQQNALRREDAWSLKQRER